MSHCPSISGPGDRKGTSIFRYRTTAQVANNNILKRVSSKQRDKYAAVLSRWVSVNHVNCTLNDDGGRVVFLTMEEFSFFVRNSPLRLIHTNTHMSKLLTSARTCTAVFVANVDI